MCHVPDGDPARSAAAVGLAALAGVELDGWQRMALDACLRRTDGRYAAFETCLIVPRQNGKSVVLGIRALAGALLFGERLVIVSAHEWRTVVELFRAADDLLAGSPLRRQVRRVRRTGGEESIELTSGARIRFMNRSKESARGFSADVVIMDEAHTVTAEQMAALLPVMSARRDPQVVYACAGPGAERVAPVPAAAAGADRRHAGAWPGSSGPLIRSAIPRMSSSGCGRTRRRRPGGCRLSGCGKSAPASAIDGFRAERLACAPWPSELDGAYGVFDPDDVRELFGRPA